MIKEVVFINALINQATLSSFLSYAHSNRIFVSDQLL